MLLAVQKPPHRPQERIGFFRMHPMAGAGDDAHGGGREQPEDKFAMFRLDIGRQRAGNEMCRPLVTACQQVFGKTADRVDLPFDGNRSQPPWRLIPPA